MTRFLPLKSVLFFALVCLIFFPNSALFSQTYINQQVIFANGGVFGGAEDVTVGTYNPIDQSYTVFDEVGTQAVQDLIIADGFAFLAASDSIIKYDLDTYERVATLAFEPLEDFKSPFQLLLYNDYLIVGKWFGGFDNFIQVFNRSDLSPVFSIPEIDRAVAGMVVIDDMLYVAQNDFTSDFYADSLGRLAIVDLATQSYVGVIELDNNDADLGNLHTDGTSIFAFNSYSQTLTTYNTETGEDSTVAFGFGAFPFFVPNYGSRSTYHDGNIYANIAGNVCYFDTEMTNLGILFWAENTALAYDYVNDDFYLTRTDFATFGEGQLVDSDGTAISTFPLGVSSECIAIDYRLQAGQVGVEWLYFEGKYQEASKSTKLTWATATESNTAHYEVEQSVEGRNFEAIGQIAAENWLNNRSEYAFEVPVIKDVPQMYYRLKQVDIDGVYEYSQTVAVKISKWTAEPTIQYQQNGESLVLQFFTNETIASSTYNFQLFDVQGKLVGQKTSVENGMWTIDNLPKGIYYYRLNTANRKVSSGKIMIQ